MKTKGISIIITVLIVTFLVSCSPSANAASKEVEEAIPNVKTAIEEERWGDALNGIDEIKTVENFDKIDSDSETLKELSKLEATANDGYRKELASKIDEACADEDWDAVKTYGKEMQKRYADSEEASAVKEKVKSIKDKTLSKLRSDYDQMEEISFYYPTNMPKYIDERCYVMPYLSVWDAGAFSMRYLMDYVGYDWLFWSTAIVSIDGEKYTINYDLSESRYDYVTISGRIRPETGDKYAKDSDIEMLKKIADSKETIIRFKGNMDYYDYTVDSRDKEAINQIMDVYQLLQAAEVFGL